MNKLDRKAAITAHKERKIPGGIYALRCAASGEIWVGQTPNLDTIRNRHWFVLAQKGSTHRSLQLAWNAHGADSFSFDILEQMEPEELTYVRDARLKERQLFWRDNLAAFAV
jgi:hypothetical protein